jgi:hypothetical protein
LESTGIVVWWQLLRVISVVNLVAWLIVARRTTRQHAPLERGLRNVLRWQIALSLVFASGCAFRSFLPGAEGQRICLSDSALSSALVTRSVATLAELSLVAQWVLVLGTWVRDRGATVVRWIPWVLLPLIAVAEVFSWYTTLTSNFLGSVVEESIWALSATLVLCVLLGLRARSHGPQRRLHGVAAMLTAAYVAFMAFVDVPMYVGRWREDEARRAPYSTVLSGLADASNRKVVTRRWEDWSAEIPWMTLYFSVGVWVSIALMRAPLMRGGKAAPTQ